MAKKYPEFTPVEVEHKKEIEEHLAGMSSRVSEFHFAEIYIWRRQRETQICELNDSIIIKLNRQSGPAYYRPFNKKTAPDIVTMEILLKDNPDYYIYGITENEMESVPELKEYFNIYEDPGDFDYIYLRDDLADLQGRKYDGKRNHIKKFLAIEGFSFEKIDEKNIKEVLEFQYEWCEMRRCDDDMSLLNEGAAAINLIEEYKMLEAFGILVRIDGRVRGYSLAVKQGDDTAIIILEKADHKYPGIYQAINNRMNIEMPEGIKYINREQDMNIEGIRKAKMSYHPVKILKKYVLRNKWRK